jgi:hypothetical protein
MLRALRRSRALLAPFAVAIASMVVLGTVDWWHATDEDDVPAAVFHDHAAHHPLLGTPRSLNNTPEHCYLCHWLRTFHNGLRARVMLVHSATEGRPIQNLSHSSPADLVASLVPARAPPA